MAGRAGVKTTALSGGCGLGFERFEALLFELLVELRFEPRLFEVAHLGIEEKFAEFRASDEVFVDLLLPSFVREGVLFRLLVSDFHLLECVFVFLRFEASLLFAGGGF